MHRFHQPGEPGNIGEAKFITRWQNKDGVWKVTRAISYDHEPVGKWRLGYGLPTAAVCS